MRRDHAPHVIDSESGMIKRCGNRIHGQLLFWTTIQDLINAFGVVVPAGVSDRRK